MRPLTHLSPTRLAAYEEDAQTFYLAHLADNRPAREPQTQPMSVGSAFDAYVKSHLVHRLFGERPAFEFATIFEAQVEPHNRDWAREAGKHCFEQYGKLGVLSSLEQQLCQAVGEPRFELEVKGEIRHGDKKVTLLGKPDLQWFNRQGLTTILDWKVNGYCSKWPPSPAPGYIRCRGPEENKSHPKCKLAPYKGAHINTATRMEIVKEEWARQLVTYAWLLGEEVGSDFVVAIDQLACNAVKTTPPTIRVAEHRCLTTPEYQGAVFNRYRACWDACTSGHFFQDRSLEESQELCAALDRMTVEHLTLDQWIAVKCS